MTELLAPPLDWSRSELQQLKAILTSAYANPHVAREVATQAGLAPGSFPIGHGTMHTLWHALLTTLANQNRARALVEQACEDALAAAWHEQLKAFLAGEMALPPPAALPAGWWRGAPASRKVVHQRQMLARARFTAVRVARRVGDAARSVVKLSMRFGDERAHGTGVLISPRHVLTNHHNVVHEQRGPATRLAVNFDDEAGHDDSEALVVLAKTDNIIHSQQDDWAVVELAQEVARKPLALGSPFPLDVDASLIIIQHPLGGKKQFTIDYLSVRHLSTSRVQYTADTQKGSSGSPVFNMCMHLVALHHAEVEHSERQGGARTTVYRNEGILIQPIIDGLRQRGFNAFTEIGHG